MTEDRVAYEPELSFWRRAVRSHLLLVAAIMVVFAAGTAIYYLLLPPSYSARAELLVDREATLSQMEFMQSRRVQLHVEEQLGFEPSVSVAGAEDRTLVTLTATASTPELAVRSANLYAETYAQIHSEFVGQGRTAQLEQITRIINEIERLQSQIRLTPEEAQELTSQRTALTVGFSQLTVPDQTPPAILSLASSADVSTPNVALLVIVATVAGVVVGVAVAGIAEQFDGRIRLPAPAAQAMGAPLLGVAPRPPRPSALARLRQRLLGQRPTRGAIAKPDTLTADAYALVRNRLQALNRYKPHGTVQVVAVDQAARYDGTTVAINLAEAMARAGLRTVLVSADYRHADMLLDLLHVSSSAQGLTEVLAGEVRMQEALQPALGTPNLKVLTAGASPKCIVDTLLNQRFRELLAKLGSDEDLVVVLTPPLAQHPEGAIVADIVGGTVVVVTRQTRRATLDEVGETLSAAGSKVLGVVFAGRYGTSTRS